MKDSYTAKPNPIGNASSLHGYLLGNVTDLSSGTELKSFRTAASVVFQLRFLM